MAPHPEGHVLAHQSPQGRRGRSDRSLCDTPAYVAAVAHGSSLYECRPQTPQPALGWAQQGAVTTSLRTTPTSLAALDMGGLGAAGKESSAGSEKGPFPCTCPSSPHWEAPPHPACHSLPSPLSRGSHWTTQVTD